MPDRNRRSEYSRTSHHGIDRPKKFRFFSTRQPIRYLLTGTLIFACTVTFLSTLIDYRVTRDPKFLQSQLILSHFLYAVLAGFVVTTLIFLYARRTRRRRSKR